MKRKEPIFIVEISQKDEEELFTYETLCLQRELTEFVRHHLRFGRTLMFTNEI